LLHDGKYIKAIGVPFQGMSSSKGIFSTRRLSKADACGPGVAMKLLRYIDSGPRLTATTSTGHNHCPLDSSISAAKPEVQHDGVRRTTQPSGKSRV
jgi:hypothetical protein